MKAMGLAESQKCSWRKIAISLIDPAVGQLLKECNRLIAAVDMSAGLPSLRKGGRSQCVCGDGTVSSIVL
jgi:hypothetical protein